mgnify:FL=1
MRLSTRFYLRLAHSVTACLIAFAAASFLFAPAVWAGSTKCDQEITKKCPAYDGWFVGGQLGQANTNVSQSQINEAFSNTGIDATSIAVKKSNFSYGLFGGYQFNQYFALQFGFLELGDRAVTFNGATADIDAFYDAAEHVYPDTAEGFNLSAVISLPLSAQWKVSGKLGLYDWERDYQTFEAQNQMGSDAISDTDVVFGLEANYLYRRDTQLFIAADTVKLKQHRVDSFNLGVRYFFGNDAQPKATEQPTITPVEPIVEVVKAEPEPAPVPVVVEEKTLPVPQPVSIYFDINRFDFTEQAKQKIEFANNILQKEPDLIATMTGYASTHGSTEWNVQLSNWRVHEVAKSLYLKDIAANRIGMAYVGDANQDDSPQSQRVDVVFTRVDKGLTASEKVDIDFGIFSDNLNSSDKDKIRQSVEAHNIEPLAYVSVVSFAKGPGDDNGLKELAASRMSKVVAVLKAQGVKAKILSSFVLLGDEQSPPGRKVQIQYVAK